MEKVLNLDNDLEKHMNKNEKMLSITWKAVIDRDEKKLEESLSKITLTSEVGSYLWSTLFSQGWIEGLDILHQNQIPGSDVLNKIYINQVENVLDTCFWAFKKLNFSFSDKMKDSLWMSLFFRKESLPQNEELLDVFPLPDSLWSKAIAKELVDSCIEYRKNSECPSGWSMVWFKKFNEKPIATQNQILEAVEKEAHNELYGDSFKNYQLKLQEFKSIQEKFRLHQVLPLSENNQPKTRI